MNLPDLKSGVLNRFWDQ